MASGLIVNHVAGNPSRLSKHAVLELGGSVILLWIVGAVLLLFAIARFNRGRHRAEQDRRQASSRRLAAEHLVQARWLAGQLLAGEVPAVEHVWDVVLQPGERVLLDGSAGYSRYYGLGSAASHPRALIRHPGRAAVGQAVPATSTDRAGVHGARVQEAAWAAAARWRDQQQSRVVVTDRRLLCQVQTKRWVSFDHAAATAMKAKPDTRAVVLEYPDDAPLCLSGPTTARIIVAVVWALYGADGLRQHPALAEVRSLAPFPEIAAPARSRPPEAATRAVSAPASLDATADGQPTDRQETADAPRTNLLQFVAGHELVLAEHVARLLGVSDSDAAAELEELVQQDLVLRIRFSVNSAVAYRITPTGGKRLAGAFRPLRPLDLAGYRPAIAVQES